MTQANSNQSKAASDILGDKLPVNHPLKKEESKKKIRIAKFGEIVAYLVNGDDGFIKYPAIVTKVNDSGSVDLNVQMPGFVDGKTKVPFSEEPTAKAFQFL